MRFLIQLGWTFILLLAAGCGDGGSFPVAATSGTVECEGQPVPHVMVFFEPISSGASALVGKQGIGFADADGKFTVSTYGDRDGAVIAKHRVRVGAPNAEQHPGFQCGCEVNSEVNVTEVDVTPDGDNSFRLVLKKKTGSEKKSLEQLEAEEEAQEEEMEKKRSSN